MTRQEAIEGMTSALVPEGIEWVKELKRYRSYQGKDRDYFHRARIALGVVSAAVRLLATRENARSNDLIEARLIGADTETKAQKLLAT